MPRIHLASWLTAAALAALSAQPGIAAGADERPTRHEIWDIKLGAKIDALPDDFIDYACGTNGGPPAPPPSGWEEFPPSRAGASREPGGSFPSTLRVQ